MSIIKIRDHIENTPSRKDFKMARWITEEEAQVLVDL